MTPPPNLCKNCDSTFLEFCAKRLCLRMLCFAYPCAGYMDLIEVEIFTVDEFSTAISKYSHCKFEFTMRSFRNCWISRFAGVNQSYCCQSVDFLPHLEARQQWRCNYECIQYLDVSNLFPALANRLPITTVLYTLYEHHP